MRGRHRRRRPAPPRMAAVPHQAPRSGDPGRGRGRGGEGRGLDARSARRAARPRARQGARALGAAGDVHTRARKGRPDLPGEGRRRWILRAPRPAPAGDARPAARPGAEAALRPRRAVRASGPGSGEAAGDTDVVEVAAVSVVPARGPDGQLCSVCACEPGSADRGADELVGHVAAPRHVEPKVARITLLPFLVVTARMVVLQVTGAAKADVVARTVKGPEDLVACPAQWIRKASGRSVLVCDAAAASRL